MSKLSEKKESRIDKIKRLNFGNAFSDEFIIEDYELYGDIFLNKNVQSIEEVSIEVVFEFIHTLSSLEVKFTIEAVRIVWMDWEGSTDMHTIFKDGNNFDTIKKFPINEVVELDEEYHFVIDADDETLTIIETL